MGTSMAGAVIGAGAGVATTASAREGAGGAGAGVATTASARVQAGAGMGIKIGA